MSDDYIFTLERLETSSQNYPVLEVNNRQYLFFSDHDGSVQLRHCVETFTRKLIEDFGITGVELKILGIRED